MSDRDEIVDRLGKRFEESEDGTERAGSEESKERSESNESRDSDASGQAQDSKNPMQAENVKEAWPATSVYLPAFLNQRLRTRYKRLDLAYEDELGESLQKTRYYYPLVVHAGLEALGGMEPREVKECIERLERDARNED